MSGSEEEIYSTIFSSLKHPARRKILRMLSEKPMTFSQMLEELGISSSHLTYHLESLGELLSKLEDGKYKLSAFGEASVCTMERVEEAPALKSRSLFTLPLKWKTLFGALMVIVVLLAGFSAIQYNTLNQLTSEQEALKSDLERVTAQNQQLLSWGTGTDKAIAFIRDVIEIDMTHYQATLLSDTVEYREDLGGVIEEVLKYSLTSSNSKIDVVLRFRDNHFSRYQLYIAEGTPIYTQPQSTNAIATTKAILEKYQTYSGDAYLAQMQQLMEAINESSNNQTTNANMKFTIVTSGTTEEILLQYTEDGVDFSAKSLRVVFQDNTLVEVTDGWFLLNIGSTQVNIQREQAIELAKTYAETFTWTVNGTQIGNFTILETPAKVQFIPHPRDEYLSLVPYWYITLQLDKTYPGQINRIAVGIWADTGEMANIQALTG
ncbi:MAG: winged helix-turn-helix domain-containing protein [Candidatus Bathyarchaeota archaeon]|nr:winged helix-turn-helix domain-containing protein [Candidatus Bathyarchaeota archaeon]